MSVVPWVRIGITFGGHLWRPDQEPRAIVVIRPSDRKRRPPLLATRQAWQHALPLQRRAGHISVALPRHRGAAALSAAMKLGAAS